MATPNLHVDRLEIDLRGISPDIARAAAATLGPALVQALASQRNHPGSRQRESIALIATPPVRVPAGVDAAGVRDAIVGQVTAAIRGAGAPPAVGSQPGREARATSTS